MGTLYVTGGQQRALRPMSGANDWYEYQKGLILEVDPANGSVQKRLEYVWPPEAGPDEDPIVLFKSASLVGDRLYASTQTEVVAYSVPSLQCLAYVSLPSFNDVHHVRPSPDGNLLVAISGLDLVQEVTLDGAFTGAVVAAAGDSAACSSIGDEATANVVDGVPGSAVALGDNVYESGTPSEFTNCYHPTWGRQKTRTSTITATSGSPPWTPLARRRRRRAASGSRSSVPAAGVSTPTRAGSATVS